MRVRYLALFFIGGVFVLGVNPSVASAGRSFIYGGSFIGMKMIPGTSYGNYQTALKIGDTFTFRLRVYSPFAYSPTASVDLSAFGVASPTTTPARPGSPNYNSNSYYDFGPLTVSTDISDGLKTVSGTIIDVNGDVATGTARIVVDSALPTVTLSNITFSTTSPRQGDHMYLSGKVDGTGSTARVSIIRMRLTDATGNPVVSPVTGGSTFSFSTNSFNAMLATSTDGSFSNMPIQFVEFGDIGWISRATNLRVDITGYDEAGNFAANGLTVLIPKTPPPDPCALPGACASNVLFLPGLKGSVLKINSDTVWPPSFWSDDLSELALTAAGDSVNPVVVDGVLETFYGTPIYSGFTAFMDELVANGTTTEWEALPYDWRFSPEKILADGIQTSTGTVDPIEKIEALAARSKTGKVIIVAHSMGGLLGKVIIKKFQDDGKENLIDSFVMVGTPQLGTPQAAASLLHGDDEGILAGFIVDSAMVRKIAQNFQSTYDLLPSPRYFDEVTEPIIVFDPGALFTQEWRDYWGPAIDTYTEFFSFITGNGVTRLDPEFTQLWIPEILRTDLTEHARDFHTAYDTYAFPDSIRVVQVAGWGMPTVKAIKYERRHFMQNYKTFFTREGDRTVVYPSAISSAADETYFLNLATYNALENTPDYEHRNLLSSSPIQQILTFVIKNEDISQTPYVVSTKPIPGSLTDQLIVSTHSPVILGAYDQNGRFSGINPSQDLGADVLSITEDIPGSTFLAFGDSQYLFLPKEGSYTVAFNGTGSGPTDVEIENFANDTSTLVATYSDIPVTASTSATFIVESISPQNAHIQVDSNNDGQVDMYIAPDNQPLTLNELLTNLKTIIQNLVIKDKLKTNLLKRIKNIEKKIAKQKNKKVSKAVMNLEKQIIKKGEKGKLSDAEVAEIVQLLEQIEKAL
jgi:pimeloyl-ACP methyl ester carboxylesterase